LLSACGHWNLTKRLYFEPSHEKLAMLMPKMEICALHATSCVLTANHFDERKDAGHSERVW
jgi:hypothetical protein